MPAAHACGRAAVGYAIGNGVSSARQPGEDLRQLVVEERDAASSIAPDDPVRLLPAPVAREPRGDQGVVVGPDGAVVVRERVVGGVRASDIVRTPQPDQSPSPISASTTASTRSSGTIPLQSRWPTFEQSESTRASSPSSASA